VETVGDLADIPVPTLCRLLGTANGRHLAALSRGEDDRSVEPGREVKSISHEETFAKDVSDKVELHRHVLRMSDAVGARLAESGLWGRTISVKIRYADRETITRSHTANAPLRASHAISAVATALLDALELPQGVRLVGVAVSGLDRAEKSVASQLSFASFGEDAESGESPEHDDQSWLSVQQALSAIRERYGQGSVGPAALVGPEGLEAKRRGDTHWGPEAEPVPSDP
jgi:DNA polymerase IV